MYLIWYWNPGAYGWPADPQCLAHPQMGQDQPSFREGPFETLEGIYARIAEIEATTYEWVDRDGERHIATCAISAVGEKNGGRFPLRGITLWDVP